MGKCLYCGQDAGFFRNKHNECEAKHLKGLSFIKQIIIDCFTHKEDFYLKDSEIRKIVQDSHINKTSLDNMFCSAFDEAIDGYLNDGIVDSAEECRY